jgi:hypothetical protein
MFLYDFMIFYNAGKAVLEGTSPYLSGIFPSPFPMALLFAPLALLPVPVAYGVFLAINLLLLWKVMRKRMVWALLSFPVLFSLFVGQSDLALALGIGAVPWLLPLAIVKPQVGFVMAPWLLRRYSRQDWLKAIGVGLALMAVSFAIRPGWVGEMLAAQPQVGDYSVRTSNLFYLIPASWMDLRVGLTYGLAAAAFLAAFFLKEKRVAWTTTHLFAPLTNIYSAAVLAEWFGPLEMLVSYVPVFLVDGYIHAGMPMYLVGLVILARFYWPQLSKLIYHRDTEKQRET